MNKQFEKTKEASPEKRYKSFLTTVSDMENIWVLCSDYDEDELSICEQDDFMYLLIWPREEYCLEFMKEGEKVRSIDVHVFLDMLDTVEDNVRFMVFPTEKNSFIVDVQQLKEDLYEYLEEVE